MNFKDYRYERPNPEETAKAYQRLLEGFRDLPEKEAIHRIEEINEVRDRVTTAFNLSSIRHSLDTADPFYEGEQSFWDEEEPRFTEQVHRFYREVLNYPRRKALEEEFGELFFRQGECLLSTFSREILEDLTEENRLCTRYNRLIASAKIPYGGGEYNLSEMKAFGESPDRKVRREAYTLVNGFFKEHLEEFDDLYDALVKVRHKMARKLGFSSFTELAYRRLLRRDYGPEEVAKFRKVVEEEWVPLAVQVRKGQSRRLGLPSLKAYDKALFFPKGNPRPKGTLRELLEKGEKMYREMGPLTGEYFSFMVERGLFDLESRKGKQAGGYCEYLPDYRSPFIFANFNGTSKDVDVLTHEAGHGLQVYLSREMKMPEYRWPTYEACEIHSMSMEFLAWPWMELFFGDRGEDYRLAHLGGTVTFVPYGVTIDEFQHFVYDNPEATPLERREKYREIERKYEPDLDYDNDEVLEKGGWWFRQGHVFHAPFYYIDYTLAQVAAFQFFGRAMENRKKAMEDYLALCGIGGSKSFLDLLKSVELGNPFEERTVPEALSPVKEYLKSGGVL